MANRPRIATVRTLQATGTLRSSIAFHEMRDLLALENTGLIDAAFFNRVRLAFAGIHDRQMGR
jgi:hypothetical protein